MGRGRVGEGIAGFVFFLSPPWRVLGPPSLLPLPLQPTSSPLYKRNGRMDRHPISPHSLTSSGKIILNLEQESGVLITDCVTSGKVLAFSGPQFPSNN